MKPALRPVTVAINENEKAWSLREINLVRPPQFKHRRYQVITVVRDNPETGDDELTEWWHDLGPAEAFTTAPFEVPSLGVHSVAELRYIAESQHDSSRYWERFADEVRAESTLKEDFLQYIEENWKRIYNQSVFGPGVTHQRNGFPRKAALAHGNGSR